VIHGLRVPVHLTTREALQMFDLADIWATRTGAEVRLVSANDHVHSRNSAHYEGEALDFHTSNPDGLSDLFRLAGYRVLWRVPGHYAHVHVEKSARGDDDESEPSLRRSRQALRHAKTMRARTGG
jgi:hypothetical protein